MEDTHFLAAVSYRCRFCLPSALVFSAAISDSIFLCARDAFRAAPLASIVLPDDAHDRDLWELGRLLVVVNDERACVLLSRVVLISRGFGLAIHFH